MDRAIARGDALIMLRSGGDLLCKSLLFCRIAKRPPRTQRRKTALNRATLRLLPCFAALLLSSAGILEAQSKDRNRPTPLTSPVISGFIDRTVAGESYYYSLTANPGSLTFTLEVDVGRDLNAWINFEIVDTDGRKVVVDGCGASNGNFCKRTATVTVARKQPILLRVEISDISRGGRYSLKIDGPLDLQRAAASSAPTSANKGKLRIEMRDGVVHEFDLANILRVQWEQ